MNPRQKFGMRPSRWLGALFTSVGLCANLFCFNVAAQGTSNAEDVAAARQLGAEGVALAHEGRCAEAVERLSRADQLFHAPTILVELGYCRCEQGQLVEGTEALNRVARENLAATAPAAFLDAQSRAKAYLEKYTPLLAKLVITVNAPPGAQFEVAVDGKPVSAALLGVPRPSDPGQRVVTVKGNGYKPAEASVTLSAGGQGEVALNLELAEVAVVDGPAGPLAGHDPGAAPPIKDQQPDKHEPNRVPMYVSYGVGAVGLIAGTVFGLSALNKKSDLDDRCTAARCPADSQADIDTMKRNANLATLGFALGVVGGALGTYFLVTEDAGPEQAAGACSQSPCLRAVLGLGALGMEGVF
jgi:hypothetical protein